MTTRTLHVIDSLGAGGAERSLVEMLPRLRDRGIEPTVAVTLASADHHRSLVPDDVPVHELAGPFVARVRSLRTLVAAARPDVLHSSLLESTLVARLARIRTGVPLLTTLVSTPYVAARRQDPSLGRAGLRKTYALDRSTWRLTTHFHAVTNAVADAAAADLHVDRRRVTVIERGRDLAAFRPVTPAERDAARRALGISGQVPLVLAMGRHDFAKGHEHLVRAAGALRSGASVTIVGRRGVMSPTLDRLAASIAPGAVTFVDHTPDPATWLRAADVFVMPSLWEGAAGALVEAMATGLPCVASDAPSLREILDDGRCGVLVPVADAPALARAVDEVLADESRAARLGAAARRHAERTYDIERAADRTAELLERVGRRERPPITVA